MRARSCAPPPRLIAHTHHAFSPFLSPLQCTAAMADYMSRIVAVRPRVRLAAFLQYRHVCNITSPPGPCPFRLPRWGSTVAAAAAGSPVVAATAAAAAGVDSAVADAVKADAFDAAAEAAAFQANESDSAVIPGERFIRMSAVVFSVCHFATEHMQASAASRAKLLHYPRLLKLHAQALTASHEE